MAAKNRSWIRTNNFTSERFSLLLLEPDEVYFDDYSVTVYPVSANGAVDEEGITRGRLKVCSHSLVYDPLDFSHPVLKLAYKDCEAILEYSDRLPVNVNNIFNKKDHSSLFYVQTKKPCYMLQNSVIAPYKFVKSKESVVFLFRLNFGDLTPVIGDICTFHRTARLTAGERDTVVLEVLKQRYSKFSFNMSWLEELQEKIILEVAGDKVTPMVANPGRILLTSHRLYFQPFNNAEVEPVLKLHLAELRRVVRRRYTLRHVGIEFITRSGETMFLVLENHKAREKLYTLVLEQFGVLVEELNLEELTRQWQWGQLSNYDYIMALNFLADRSLNDITQYPVFPWVIADYSSKVLDLSNPATFRDLSKPIGALNEERLESFKDRYEESPGKKFLYGTHYSAPAFVLYYLVRTAPEYLLCLQNGHFDHPNRMFHSIASTWNNVLTSATDVKELIPEFYEPPGNFLLNSKNLDMGTRSSGEKLGHVVLPPWAKGAHDFTVKCREALECAYVSDHLHLWIDLIFGFKQRGQEAVKADNVFHYLTYEGEVDLEKVKDPTELTSYKVQIREFGQTPKQLFFTPHPPRTAGKEEPLPRPSEKVQTPSLPPAGKDSPLPVQHSPPAPSTPACLSPSSPPTPSTPRLPWNQLCVCHQDKVHKEAVTGVKFAPDGSAVFTTSKDKNLKMFSVHSRDVTAQASLTDLPLSCLAVLPDSKTVLVGCWDNYIYAYSIEYGAKLTSVYAHDSSVSCIHLRGNTLASGSWDSAVKVWAVSTHAAFSLTEVAEFDHEGEVSCVALDPNCTMVAAGSAEGSVVIWNIDTQEELSDIRNVHSGPVHALTFKDDGVVVSSGADSMLCLIRVQGGGAYVNLPVPDQFRCLTLHRDYVIAGGSNGVLYVWSLATQHEVFRKQAHSGPISCLDVLGDMELVVTGSEDRTIAIWKFGV